LMRALIASHLSYFATQSGRVYAVCPLVPRVCVLPVRTLTDLADELNDDDDDTDDDGDDSAQRKRVVTQSAQQTERDRAHEARARHTARAAEWLARGTRHSVASTPARAHGDADDVVEWVRFEPQQLPVSLRVQGAMLSLMMVR
jgi:hypothetical protein